jgi:phage portal protein BeeE
MAITYIYLALPMWEQTVLPMVENVVDDLNGWLTEFYSGDLEMAYSTDDISALSLRREALWNRVGICSFMTINEKRQAVGLGPIAGGDGLK